MALDLEKYKTMDTAYKAEEDEDEEDEGPAAPPPPKVSRPAAGKGPPEPKKNQEKNAAMAEEVLRVSGIDTPKEAEEPGFWSRRFGNLIDFVYNFERPGSAVRSGLIKAVDQTKEAVDKYGARGMPENEELGTRLRSQLARQGEQVAAMKKGFVESRDKTSGGRELLASIFGEGNVKAAEDYLGKLPKAPKLEDKLIPGDSPGAQAIKGHLQRYTPVGMISRSMKSTEWMVKHGMTAAYLGTEILTDPLTYIGFGGPKALLQASGEAMFKGAFKGLAKISPKTAEIIEKVAQKSSSKIGDAYAKIYRKFDALRAAKEVLPEEQAIGLVDDIRNAHIRPGAEVEKTLLAMQDTVGRSPKVGFLRRNFRKAAEGLGLEPKSRMMRYLTATDDKSKAMDDLYKALNQANDEAMAVLPDELAAQTKKVIGDLVDGKVDDAEMTRLFKAYDVGKEGKGKVQEYLAKKSAPDDAEILRKIEAGATSEEIESFQMADKLKEGFQGGRTKMEREGVSIAKDRRNLRIVQLQERLRGSREVLIRSRQEANQLQSEMNKRILRTKEDGWRFFKEDLAQKRKSVIEDMKGLFDELKSERNAQVKALQESINRGETPVQRARWLKKRDLEIARVKKESMASAYKIKEIKRAEIQKVTAQLEKETAEKIAADVTKVKSEFSSRISEIQHGIPSRKQLMSLYQQAKGKINKQYVQERNFFTGEVKKVHFLDQYQKMLSAKADRFEGIFERTIADLPKQHQDLARLIRNVMDAQGAEEVARGKLGLAQPNYFPRMAQRPKDGWLEFNAEDFEKGIFRLNQGTGLSRFTKKRIMQDWSSFKQAVERKGGKANEDVFEIVYNRVLASKKDQAFQAIIDMIPPALKTGVNGRRMRNYVNYLYNGGSVTDNLVKKVGGKFLQTYNYLNKTLLTVPAPAFHTQNLMSAPFMTAYKAGMQALNPKTYAEAVAIKIGAKSSLTNKLGEKISAQEFIDAMENFGAIRTSFTRGDITQNVNNILNRYSKADPRYWVTRMMHVGQHVEDMNRIHAGYVFWKDGKTLRKAAELSKASQFDYTDTNEISKAIQGLYAFFTFQNKVVPATVKAMIDDPKQFAMYSRISRNFSEGKPPTEEELQTMQKWDKDQLWFFGNTIKGLQPAYKFGFLPIQSGFSHAKYLLTGDIDGWLGAHASSFSQLHKATFKMAARYIMAGEVKEKYKYLPKQYSLMPKSALKVLSAVQETLGSGPVQLEDYSYWKGGQERTEQRIKVSPGMYDLITGVPTSRLTSDVLNLAYKRAEKDGVKPEETSVVELLSRGYLKGSDEVFDYLFNLRQQDFDWDRLQSSQDWKKNKAIMDQLEAAGLASSFPYLNKKKIRQWDDIKAKVDKRLRDEKTRKIKEQRQQRGLSQ
ncbi:MAG TPA: hypothetical protein VFW62_02630 [bacterium]|nr:hypothetical protein [bacterium]